jgi:hypothetical protein
MSSSIEEVIVFRPVYITATNMIVPVGTVSLSTIKNILEPKIITILNIFDSNISRLNILVIMGFLAVYNLYKLIRYEYKV